MGHVPFIGLNRRESNRQLRIFGAIACARSESDELEFRRTNRRIWSRARQREHHKHGRGALSFTEVSDQTWMSLSAGSGTTPSTLQVSPSMTGLKAGTYTGHVLVTGGGTTRIVTVSHGDIAPGSAFCCSVVEDECQFRRGQLQCLPLEHFRIFEPWQTQLATRPTSIRQYSPGTSTAW